MLQFTIPFINRNAVQQVSADSFLNEQPPLFVNLGVHGGSDKCTDIGRNKCDYEVNAYKIHEANRYATEDWKGIHRIPVYNKDDGVYEINKHITLRLQTGITDGHGSKIFEHLILPDIQVL